MTESAMMGFFAAYDEIMNGGGKKKYVVRRP